MKEEEPMAVETLKVNLYRKYISKYSRCGEPGVSPKAPKPDENPSGMRGNKDWAMNHTELYKPT